MPEDPSHQRSLRDREMRPISSVTLSHYESRAEAFRAGTADHDVTQNIHALLRHLPARRALSILDFGCGPGRDLRTFSALGHHPIGLDGAQSFVQMAKSAAGVDVWHQDFLALDLPDDRFDGVFANASLFHVPSEELPRVLRELWSCLKGQGALFSSNPLGPDEEGWSGERYACHMTLETWRTYLTGAGFIELEHYYRPTGKPRHLQPWLATVWRKP